MFHKVLFMVNPMAGRQRIKTELIYVVDALTKAILDSKDLQISKWLLLQRAIANTVVQNYGEAIDDLNTCLDIDPNMTLALWQRGVCSAMMNE